MKPRKVRIATILSVALIALSIMAALTGVPRAPFTPQPITQASPSSLTEPATLHARGATFPAPLISAYVSNYQSQNSNVTISYQALGSGAGQRAFINKTDDFDASDAPLNSQQRILAPNVLHIPETIGSVTLSYNLTAAGIPAGLDLTGAVIAQIYLGVILNWNDPAIQSLNPGFVLPNHSITTVHRMDSSGTTFVFTSFLSQDSSTWATTVGSGTTVTWPGSPTGSPPPIALSGNGNGGVASVIKSTPYSIGYVELNYALSNSFTFANVQNPAGTFVTPSLTTTQNAIINYGGTFPTGAGDWSSVSLLNQPGAQTYPIASFSYFLVYRELNVVPSMDLNETFQSKALINFLYWAVNNPGQSLAPTLKYVPLPTNIRLIDNASIASITFTIDSTPVSKTINLSVSNTGGWSTTAATVTSGDAIALSLSSTDGLTHQWFLDLNNNGVVDANETASPSFSSTTPIPFVFTPKIGVNIPTGGNWVYKDANNLANTGMLTVMQQQSAGPLHPASTLNSPTFTPTIDGSRVTTVGTIIVDTRTDALSGNITLAAVDSTSGSNTFTKAYIFTKLQPGVTVHKIVFNVQVLPYALSSDIVVQISGLTPTISKLLSRELDPLGQGSDSFLDVSFMASLYGAVLGQPSYNPTADVLAHNQVDFLDISTEAFYFQAPVFR
ncbi:MAG TPA: phosphate ABC transporter substrate-binding protein PstS [Candidatus Angelobacter sp.]|nr:phosphate ABC transporter substrate-binding protein PstS [Candidatus Angelobacter sp.]